MGAVVAFEFARIAESRGAAVERLWASAAPAPSAVAGMPELPTSHDDLLVDIADFGGTDADLLADPEFAELLVTAMRADYQAINRYTCGPEVRIAADISVLGARGDPASTPPTCSSGATTPRAHSTCPGTTADISTSTITSTPSPLG